jgi:DNA-binding cell septation regulator SpoVG
MKISKQLHDEIYQQGYDAGKGEGNTDIVKRLKIEVARMHKLDGTGSTKAFCDISVAEVFVVKGFRVIDGKERVFVSPPREELNDGKWYPTFIPLRREVKDEIEKVILEVYGA